jgi:hypothetical protein
VPEWEAPTHVPQTGAYRLILLPAGMHWIDAHTWRLAELPLHLDADLAWGEARADRSVRAVGALTRTLHRELAIAVLRLGIRRGDRFVHVRRLALSGGPHPSLKQLLARGMRRGTIIELASSPRLAHSLLDRIMSAADLRPAASPLVGAEGGVIQRASTAAGRPAILRVGFRDEPSDPAIPAEALRRLAAVPAIRAPALLDRGKVDTATWSLEMALVGRGCTELTPAIWAAMIRAWSQLPLLNASPRATSHDLEYISRCLPQYADSLAALDRMAEHAHGDGVRGIFAHRDLWLGNLLIDRGRVSGVIDWGSWRADAMPGSDLLQLYARRRRESLGAAWLRRPWLEPTFCESMRSYWTAVGVTPDHAFMEGLGIAWWATEVSGTLERIPHRRHDRRWLDTNVRPVLAAMDRR